MQAFVSLQSLLQQPFSLLDCHPRLRQDDLSRSSQRTRGAELVLIQIVNTAGRCQYGKCSTCSSCRHRDLGAVGAAAGDLDVGDVSDHVDQGNVKWCTCSRLDGESRGVIGELQWGTSGSWGLEIWWWHRWGLERKLWQDGEWELHRARTDEHLSQVVCVDASQGGVESCGEWRTSNTGSEVGIVARLDCEDAACCSKQSWVIGQVLSSAEVCADADRCDHVGEVDEGGGRVVRELVCAWWHR